SECVLDFEVMICSGGCLGLFGFSDLGGFSGNGFVEEGFVRFVQIWFCLFLFIFSINQILNCFF
ncbi:hypothetical protein, partial [Klebsiella pneumoniae]|uniref:hypothetical protein n=1 Tax=Klebsiella pneumoniae TaxID=573 RepID=UPI00301376DB